MFNPYQTQSAKIVKITELTPGIKLFEFDFKLKKFVPGQFMILSFPGFGEGPFAPCSRPDKNLELCVRAVGQLTNKLHLLKIGDKVGLRGPFGNGWPIRQLADGPNPAKWGGQSKNNLLIVVGGLGLIPLRSLILAKDKFFSQEQMIQIFYGARTPDDFLFKAEFDGWRKMGIDVELTIDKECKGWDKCVGLVTVLFDKRNVLTEARAFLCGPPMMYKAVLQKIKERKFKDEDIYLSLERRMHCGVGVCQHCAVGSFYTCKHGPVFRYDQIREIQGAI